jgi:hypothetical protein
MRNVIFIFLSVVLLSVYAGFIIWSLNTLFSLNIQYTWQTFAAALIILLALPGQIPPFKK